MRHLADAHTQQAVFLDQKALYSLFGRDQLRKSVLNEVIAAAANQALRLMVHHKSPACAVLLSDTSVAPLKVGGALVRAAVRAHPDAPSKPLSLNSARGVRPTGTRQAGSKAGAETLAAERANKFKVAG